MLGFTVRNLNCSGQGSLNPIHCVTEQTACALSLHSLVGTGPGDK